MNSRLEQFGDERLSRALVACRSQSLEEGVSKLMRDVEEWCGREGPKDDVSILALEAR
jgi:serine phosphatase RsbU (regulator of sigma subunit)